MKESRKFHCKIEELPVIAGFLLNSFIRDQEDFTAFSASFNSDYINNYKSLIEQTKTMANASIMRAEKAMITGKMYEDIDNLRPLLLKIEGYVVRAEGLKTQANDFGFAALRKAVKAKNKEGVLFLGRSLQKQINDNIDALTAKGLSPELQNAFSELIKTINSNNLVRQQKVSGSAELTSNNLKVLNELWDKMSELMDTGKRIYKYNCAYKLPNYTFTKLRTHVNRTGMRKANNVEIEQAAEM